MNNNLYRIHPQPSYIADPCGPKRQLLPAILQAVSQRMERAA